MFNFNYALDNDLKDLEQMHASAWHEAGHWAAARSHGIEHEMAVDPTRSYPRITHSNPDTQDILDFIPFVIDGMAIAIDIGAYADGQKSTFNADLTQVDYGMLRDHINYRLETGFGCLRGCSDPDDLLLMSDDWLERVVSAHIPIWERIAFRAVRLWSYRFSRTWAEGCSKRGEIHVCTEYVDVLGFDG